MSIVDISLDLENLPDQMLQQLGQGGDPQYPQYLVLAEVQRRKDMRDRYQAQQAKQQAANPPSIAEQRMAEMGGIPGADPNMAPPDPSLQTGIAGPPEGGPPPMAGGGMIPGYQGGDLIDDPLSPRRRGSSMDIDPMTGKPRDTLDRIANLGEFDMSITPVEDVYAGQGVNLGEAQTRLGHDPRSRSEIPFGEKLSRFLQGQPIGDWSKDEIREIQRMMESGELDSSDPDVVGQLRGLSGVTGIQDIELPTDLFGIETDLPGLGGVVEGQEGEGVTSTGPQELVDVVGTNQERYDELFRAGDITRDQYLEAMDYLEGGGGGDQLQRVMDSIGATWGGGGGAGSLGSLGDISDELKGHIEDYRTRQQEYSPELEERDRLRGLYEESAHGKAEGIRALEQDRLKEQESILAERLGVSEERVRELMREMDTPEEIESRRKAGLFSALGATLMGSPTGLAAGLERTTDKLTSLDDVLRAERKTALGDILAEREKGLERKATGRKGIYDLTKSSQEAIDTADLALENFDVTLAKEAATRGLQGEKDALDAYMKLGESQMRQVGAWNNTMATLQAQMQEATLNKENFTADPANWENIKNRHADILAEIAGSPHLSSGQKEAATKNWQLLFLSQIRALGYTEQEQTDQILAMTGNPIVTEQISLRNTGPLE